MSYTALTTDDQVVSSEIVVSTAWTNNTYSLNNFYTSSTQEADTSGKFFLGVYQEDPLTSNNAENQFDVAWGDNTGSGSAYFNSTVPNNTSTKDIYRQYRALILGDENSGFTFDTDKKLDQIAVISVARSKYKQAFNAGSLSLTLTNGGNTLTFTDNSQIQTSATFINNTQYYTLVSGSQGNVNNSTPTPSGSYGYIFPDLGTIILNPNALKLSPADGGLGITWDYSTPSSVFTLQSPNNRIIYNTIKAGGNFGIQASEVISSNYIFCRTRNAENNYTANPTIIDSDGNLIYNQLIYSPVTYITSVGLYNDRNELLAVAKLSKPLQKDFTKEALVRIKMDF